MPQSLTTQKNIHQPWLIHIDIPHNSVLCKAHADVDAACLCSCSSSFQPHALVDCAVKHDWFFCCVYVFWCLFCSGSDLLQAPLLMLLLVLCWWWYCCCFLILIIVMLLRGYWWCLTCDSAASHSQCVCCLLDFSFLSCSVIVLHFCICFLLILS